jgi:hypothetical protein
VTGDTALDILAVQDLCARYCLLLDVGDMASWEALWAEDAEMHAFRQVWTGPGEIAEHIGQADPGLHMAGVPSIAIDGDRARGWQNFLFVEQNGQGLRLGRYVDEFVRTLDGWRFARRQIVFMRSTPPA